MYSILTISINIWISPFLSIETGDFKLTSALNFLYFRKL
jgi:hypothetical protein